MNATPAAIWCDTCALLAPIDEWRRKIHGIRVVAGTRIVGYVSTYEHGTCHVFTAVPVRAAGSSIATGVY